MRQVHGEKLNTLAETVARLKVSAEQQEEDITQPTIESTQALLDLIASLDENTKQLIPTDSLIESKEWIMINLNKLIEMVGSNITEALNEQNAAIHSALIARQELYGMAETIKIKAELLIRLLDNERLPD